MVVAAGDRHQFLVDTQDALSHLSEQTGGFAILNTNDLANGFKRITDDQRGYYLIGYVPDDGTFAKPGKTVRYHKISVEVKRRGLTVRTHKAFLGFSDDDKRTAPSVGGDLLLAALSPFDSDGIPVSLTTRPSDANGKLSIVGQVRADGIGEQGADVLGLVIDANGTIVSSGTSRPRAGRNKSRPRCTCRSQGRTRCASPSAIVDRPRSDPTPRWSGCRTRCRPRQAPRTSWRRSRTAVVSRRWLAVGLIAGVLSAALVRASSQAPAAVSQPQPVFRVGVDAVRIDAVVTDKDGRIVTDLTAKDFELRQDGKVQDITLARFVPVQTSARTTGALRQPVVKKGEPAPPPPPAPKLSKEQVQRSIALVVDDLSLSAESFEYTRQGLHKFIDTQLQPTDLVALVRTSAPGGTMQPFTTDRRLLHAQVDGMRWTVMSRNGVESFEAVQGSFLGIGMAAPPGGQGPPRPGSIPTDFSVVNDLRRHMSAAGTLGALNLIIRGASELPGRRAIVLLSEGFALMTNDRGAYMPEPRTRLALDRAIEAALRHGVVVYSVDVRGLQTGRMLASDDVVGNASAG